MTPAGIRGEEVRDGIGSGMGSGVLTLRIALKPAAFRHGSVGSGMRFLPHVDSKGFHGRAGPPGSLLGYVGTLLKHLVSPEPFILPNLDKAQRLQRSEGGPEIEGNVVRTVLVLLRMKTTE